MTEKLTPAERGRNRREALKAQHRCVDCKVQLPSERLTVRCEACAEKANRASRNWQNRNHDRRREERCHYYLSLYWSNREVYLERDRARKLQKKLDGICMDCPAPSLDDNVRCGVCRDRDNDRRRVGSRKIRSADLAAIREYRPIEDVVNLTRVRILRAAQALDWFTSGDLFEVLGGDDTQRNTIQVTLGRLTKAGLFERRKVAMRYRGPDTGLTCWEHMMTDAGRAALEQVLQRTRAPESRAA